mmetsp:Transcript_18586/g.38234  ORF Transcript_18586/g.38234 Transcript_18586/m.38234 type:complete len:80 (+) Transcript_18586:759-998(+)
MGRKQRQQCLYGECSREGISGSLFVKSVVGVNIAASTDPVAPGTLTARGYNSPNRAQQLLPRDHHVVQVAQQLDVRDQH